MKNNKLVDNKFRLNKKHILITSGLILSSLLSIHTVEADSGKNNVDPLEATEQSIETYDKQKEEDITIIKNRLGDSFSTDVIKELSEESENSELFGEALINHESQEWTMAQENYAILLDSADISSEAKELVDNLSTSADNNQTVTNYLEEIEKNQSETEVDFNEQEENNDEGFQDPETSDISVFRNAPAQAARTPLSATYQQDFIDKLAPYAVEIGKEYGLYPSVIIAQASLETGYGTSELASVPNHNLFGVKGNYNGTSVSIVTGEHDKDGEKFYITASFKKYPSYTESLKDYAEKIRYNTALPNNPYVYAGTWIENATNYKEATAGLTPNPGVGPNWATNPNYSARLNSLIERYSLTKFDEEVINSFDRRSADKIYKDYQAARYVSTRWDLAQDFKKAYPNDARLNKMISRSAQEYLNEGRYRQNRGEHDRALVYYNRILAESLASEFHGEVQKYVAEIEQAQNSPEANKLYEKFQAARYVSARWDLAQDFKVAHPEDSRVNKVIQKATQGYLNEGRYRHNRGEYDRALIYYNRILAESLATDFHSEVQKLVAEIEQEQNNPEADKLYEEFQAARYVSARWNLAQEFKASHANDSRVNKIVKKAAQGYLNEGRYRHNRGEYDRALIYYNQILDEKLATDFHGETQKYVDQINQIQNIPAADKLYSDFQAARYVSIRWDLAQDFKKAYPNDARLNEMIRIAADGYLNEGRYRHNRGEYDRALIYYNHILDEDLATSLHGVVGPLANQAESGNKLKTANDYYNDFNKAYYVSERWSIAQEFKQMFPNDSRVRTVMNEAAHENLHEGLRSKSEDKFRAKIYYNRVIEEPYVSQSTRHLAKIFNNQLSEHRKRIVYVDPGHGGHLPGAVYAGVTEKQLNMEVSNYLIDELEARGYLVMTSRTSDMHVELIDRAREANGGDADIFISVHHNAGGGRARGIETYIYHRVASGFGQETNHNNFKMNDPRISESVRLANSLQNNLIQDTGLNNRGVKGNNFSVLRNTHIPAVLVELGYMDTPSELAIIRTAAYQKQAAKSIATGVDTYFNR